MTRREPTFAAGSLQVRDHQVVNCWLIPGDTPDFIRVYPNPRNLSVHDDIYDLSKQCYSWTNLPSGTALTFTVSCMYPGGDEWFGSFDARTTGPLAPPDKGGTPPPAAVPEPVLQNLSVTVIPYLRGATLEWDVLANVGQVNIYYAVTKGAWMGLGGMYNTDGPAQGQHMTYVIPAKNHLQYGRTFYVRLEVSALEGGVPIGHDFFTEFTTPDDPRFNDDPERSERPISIRDQFKNKGFEQVGELDPEAGPHRRLSP